MHAAVALLGFITLQRLAELCWSARNTRRLRTRGAVEFGQKHYPLILGFHAAWLAGLWLLGWNHSVESGWLAAFLLLQALRFWILFSLGERWTTRVLVLPGAALIRRGPYGWLRHPNYAVVGLEIAVVPLALDLVWFAAIFSLLHIPLILHRIAVENTALAWARQGSAPGNPAAPDFR